MKLKDGVAGLRRALWRGGDPSDAALPSFWEGLLGAPLQAASWKAAREAAAADSSAPRVLIATSVGAFSQQVTLEAVLGVALTLRGARVDYLLCDKRLPACQATKIWTTDPGVLLAQAEQPRCGDCQPAGERVLGPLGLRLHHFGRWLRDEDSEHAREVAQNTPLADVAAFREDDMAIGEQAWAGALRYYARGDLQEEPGAEPITRRYLEASVLSARAVRNLIRAEPYDVAVFHHGLYVPQGVIGEVCRREGLRVVNWETAYRQQCFLFSEEDTYHRTMISEPTSRWEQVPWNRELEERVLDYLRGRWRGTFDWIRFNEHPEEDPARIREEVGVDFSKPLVTLLTNVLWDAQLIYESNAYPSMLQWIRETIEHFAARPEIQLAIRIHPVEARRNMPCRQPVAEEIRRAFPNLPANVFVVPPESQVSTYALCERSNAVLIYGTKAGLEVASMGIPVVVAGEAWIRNKGFSRDAETPENYRDMLRQLPLPERMSPEEVERARRYAFHYFFRRMIELPFVTAVDKGEDFELTLENLDELRAGRQPGLDVICRGILEGAPFVFPAESQ